MIFTPCREAVVIKPALLRSDGSSLEKSCGTWSIGVLECWKDCRGAAWIDSGVPITPLLHRPSTPDLLIFTCEYYLTKSIDSFILLYCLSGGLLDVRGGSIWRKAVQGECG
jgi:hypothetical protein